MFFRHRSIPPLIGILALIFALGSLLPSSDAHAVTSTLTPTADTFVRGGTYELDNYGTLTELVVKDGPDTSNLYDRRAYLKFSLSGVSGTVSRALLHLHVSSVQTGATSVPIKLTATGDSWTESGLTWQSQPTLGSDLTTGGVTGVGRITLDVTSYVSNQAAGDDQASFVVIGTNTYNYGIDIDSRESVNKPALEIITDATTEPPLLPGPTTPSNNGPFFHVKCNTSHRAGDDPIVYPGINNATHEHQFFGSTTTNESSTYASMISSPTTCLTDAKDTAAYWIPTIYDANGQLQSPYRVRAYYYAETNSPAQLQPYPANLRIIAGDARATGVQPEGVIEWLCRDRLDQSPTHDVQSATPPTCLSTQYLSLSIRFPNCLARYSDGTPMLDSSDHRRHMAYATASQACPSSHPIRVPRLRLSITYETPGYSGGNFTLGGPSGGTKTLPWSGMHADFWNTWDQAALTEYVNECLKTGQTDRPAGCNVIR
jgi:hypothetical protein